LGKLGIVLTCIAAGLLAFQLDSILSDPKLNGAIVSATVCRADGSIIYEKNSATHVVPASNEKLFSAAFALNALGPDFRPQTLIWKQPNRTYIQTTGDPLMSYGQLVGARDRLRLDRRLSVSVNEPYAPEIPSTWEHDDLSNKYAAPVAAFTVDKGSFELWWKKGRLVAQPFGYGVQFFRAGGDGAPKVQYDPFLKRAFVFGKMPATDKRLDTLAIPNPDREAAFLLGKGFLRTADPAPNTPPCLVLTGKPLREIVAACLPVSDNNIAENLLLMAARSQGELGDDPYAVARTRLTDFLTHVVGIDPEDVKPYDGSGLSRHNFLTTRAIAKLLCWAQAQPTSDAWNASLARPGMPGTLSKRLVGIDFRGKTGTLDMVVALSGYVRHKSGDGLVASMIVNQFGCSSNDVQNIEEAFMRAVATSDLPPR
jgi:D-alanyl-D-alanine carboxypeptidase/D-alanyl-D-alanine-endopeptidase (penicillin-binding protein 4)